MGKHLLQKKYIAKLNELTELGVSELIFMPIDETTLAVLKR